MAAVMWIEVLSRHGEVASRHRIDTAEARIGRAFDNDVVVDDPHVAPHHVRVVRGEDGGLVALDLGTVNGLYAEHGAKPAPVLELTGQPGIRIGRTTLRIHDATRPVAPEKPLTPARRHAAWAGGLTAGLLLLLMALNALENPAEARANVVLLPLLGLAVALAAWTTLWAVLSRVFLGQARFAVHLRIAATACIALVAWDQLAEAAAFAFAWRDMIEMESLGAWALLAATCYAHLHAIGPRHMRAATAIVTVLIASGAALQQFMRLESRQLVGQRAHVGELRPPALRLAPLASTDEFFLRAEETRRRVDEARAKEPPPGGPLSDAEPPD